MENYLYFAEADVETGADSASEAITIPASSYLFADPLSTTVTNFYFKSILGSDYGMQKVALTHTASKNKDVIKGVLACINSHPSKGGFIIVANANAAALTTGTEYNAVFNGLGLSTVAITQDVAGATSRNDIAVSSGTTNSYSYGAGIISTGTGAAGAPKIFQETTNGRDIITSIEIDLTGLANKNDVGDVIGISGTDGAYFFKNVASEIGVITKIEMTCLELPTASSNPGLDIDISCESVADGAYDDDGSSYTVQLASGGDMALGQTFTSANPIAAASPANDYFYLLTGATHTGDSTYTGGNILVKIYSHLDWA